MLQLVIPFLSRDTERLQITHPTQTSQFESLHPAKEKSSLETRKISYHLLCTPSMPLFHQTKRSHRSSGLPGCKVFFSPFTKEQSSVSPRHLAQDSPRQLFLKLPLEGLVQKLAPETGSQIINQLDSIYTLFYTSSFL